MSLRVDERRRDAGHGDEEDVIDVARLEPGPARARRLTAVTPESVAARIQAALARARRFELAVFLEREREMAAATPAAR